MQSHKASRNVNVKQSQGPKARKNNFQAISNSQKTKQRKIDYECKQKAVVINKAKAEMLPLSAGNSVRKLLKGGPTMNNA